MSDELEEVNADEVAELERLAELATQAVAAEKLRAPDRRPTQAQVEAEWRKTPKGAPMSTHESWDEAQRAATAKRQPPPPLRPFVDVATVEAHLQVLDARLQQIEAQTRHTMLLTMVLSERFQVTVNEYGDALAKTEKAEQAAKGHS